MAEVIGNVEDLVAIIRRSAQQQALSEEADTRAFAQEKLAEAKTQAAQIKEDLLGQARRQAEQEKRRIVAQADLDAQRHRLHAAKRCWKKCGRRRNKTCATCPVNPIMSTCYSNWLFPPHTFWVAAPSACPLILSATLCSHENAWKPGTRRSLRLCRSHSCVQRSLRQPGAA